MTTPPDRTRLVLRRETHASDAATSVSQVEQAVVACDGCVLGREDSTLLVEAHREAIASLREKLDGWVVAEAAPRIPVPTTRFKLP